MRNFKNNIKYHYIIKDIDDFKSHLIQEESFMHNFHIYITHNIS